MPMSLRSKALSLVAPALLGAGMMTSPVACGQFTLIAERFGDKDIGFDPPPAGAGGAGLYRNDGGAGGGNEGGGTATTSGSGAGSFSHLCGGSAAMCTPGTDDCTPGGDPNMGGGSPDASKIGCQLSATSSLTEAKCGPVGSFGDGDPCSTVADCQAGLGCVATTEGVSLCRPYCCGDVNECPDDTYCAPEPMAESLVQIPVCIPASNCELLNDATCKNGQTCTIVRDDGTTSCVDPGTGASDEACPCAAGFYCSSSSGVCLELCHTEGDDAECGADGKCQGGVKGPYPVGFGVCVTY
jgi:hypothetical protein